MQAWDLDFEPWRDMSCVMENHTESTEIVRSANSGHVHFVTWFCTPVWPDFVGTYTKTLPEMAIFWCWCLRSIWGRKRREKKKEKVRRSILSIIMQRISLITLPNIIIWSFQCAIIILMNLERDNFLSKSQFYSFFLIHPGSSKYNTSQALAF